jgi:uncharacterized protein YndB with AHSA1/START domain
VRRPHSEPPSGSLVFEHDLPHRPETVWRALSDPALLAEWLLPPVDFEPEAGATFAFLAPPQPGWDGIVRCRVLEVEPQRRLRLAWVVGDIDTVVTFTLASSGTGTRLTIVHSGFRPDQEDNLRGARYGWATMGKRLVDLLERLR